MAKSHIEQLTYLHEKVVEDTSIAEWANSSGNRSAAIRGRIKEGLKPMSLCKMTKLGPVAAPLRVDIGKVDLEHIARARLGDGQVSQTFGCRAAM